MSSIYGVNITADSIINCYKRYYSESYNDIANERLFHYLHLWGIRVSTHDTALPDDYIGGLRINNWGFNEIVFSKGSTDPSPKYIIDLYDAEAKKKGGTAFLKEGQHLYKYMGRNHGSFATLPSFCPKEPLKADRWAANESEKNLIRSKKPPIDSLFTKAKQEGRTKNSDVTDACIHKSWAKSAFWNDSAGCQILLDDDTLSKLGTFASEHIKEKKYGDLFTYTLFSLDQFMQANTNGEPYNKETAVNTIISKGKYGLGKIELNKFGENFLLPWGRAAFRGSEYFLFGGQWYNTKGGRLK